MAEEEVSSVLTNEFNFFDNIQESINIVKSELLLSPLKLESAKNDCFLIIRVNAGLAIGSGTKNKLYCSLTLNCKNITLNSLQDLITQSLASKGKMIDTDAFGSTLPFYVRSKPHVISSNDCKSNSSIPLTLEQTTLINVTAEETDLVTLNDNNSLYNVINNLSLKFYTIIPILKRKSIEAKVLANSRISSKQIVAVILDVCCTTTKLTVPKEVRLKKQIEVNPRFNWKQLRFDYEFQKLNGRRINTCFKNLAFLLFFVLNFFRII
jgi:hypothetical protein